MKTTCIVNYQRQVSRLYTSVLFLMLCIFSTGVVAQNNPDSTQRIPATDSVNRASPKNTVPSGQVDPGERLFRDVVAIGLGLGLDYGGIGANVTVYPQKNIGIFGGVGYAFVGAGYNLGTKLRIIPKERFMKISPFVVGMYGYNAFIKVTNKSEYDKFFYGFSAGAGADIRFPMNKGYLSLGVTIPLRDGEMEEYMDYLEANKGVRFEGEPLPFTISVGYRFVIY